jgi:glycosyltransferase involved in cell wall biosynthesis
MSPMANQPNSLPQLTREEMTPPVIQPVPAGIKRPRWSVMIPTYNCARFLRETIESVLTQDINPAEMQIEVIDDCSTSDDPEAVVREFGQGRVRFYRKPANAGAIPNFNTCIERCTGYYVHILHGDDFVKPGFYQAIDGRSKDHGDEIDLFIVRCLVVDEQGALDSLAPRITDLESPSCDPSYMFLDNSIRTPGCVIRRSFYEQHGGFLTPLVHTADWEMWARATALGKGLFVNEPLAVYRSFGGNDTGRLVRAGENIRDYYRLSQVMADRYPTFPRLQFVQVIVGKAAEQLARFEAIGDQDAADANRFEMMLIKKGITDEKNSLARRRLRKFWLLDRLLD